ncbi:unnamed protein product [Symbiodinium natans]|uniref:Uncharacterized protein n=1 Tax=Symbiodinium natans TaxID=878477 RepID=A0A812PJ30_9DINO|nr:unnamed protein product [Symbiodinium natans]
MPRRTEYEALRRVLAGAGAPPEASAAELRQLDEEYQKQRNALVVTQDAAWSAEQEAAYAAAQIARLKTGAAEASRQAEEVHQELQRLAELGEEERRERQRALREREVADAAEEETAIGQRQLQFVVALAVSFLSSSMQQEELRLGRRHLEGLRSRLESTLFASADQWPAH